MLPPSDRRIEDLSFAELERLAELMYEEGNFQAAATYMQHAVKLPQADSSTHFNLGQALFGVEQYEAAAYAFSGAIPKIADAYVNRGLSWEMIGDTGAARRDYRSALSINIRDVDALVNIGTLDLMEERVCSAEIFLRWAALIDPRCNWQLSDVFIHYGDLDQAAKLLEIAVAAGEERAATSLTELRA
ncbi:tetratricopeptide repeat protein [Microbacterium testaceum]|uniref:tetratricopeptide repeat protein n=1 Tax=Microbacterium testaceum TaxID=2033 RepID=UPI000B3373EE|nr:tetratricopeptide repeat protein [Microbacterium testaceum]